MDIMYVKKYIKIYKYMKNINIYKNIIIISKLYFPPGVSSVR